MSFWSSRVETSAAVTWKLLIRLWWRVLCIGGALFAAYRLRSIITTLILTAIIAYVLDPSVEWLCRRNWFTRAHYRFFGFYSSLMTRFKGKHRQHNRQHTGGCKHHTIRLCASTYVFILAILLLWQGGKLVVTPFAAEIGHLMSPQGRFELMKKKVEILTWYDKSVPEWMQSDKIQDQAKSLDLTEPLQHLAGEVGRGVMEGAKGIVEVVLIPVLAFYVLVDGRRLKHEFVGMVPVRSRRECTKILNEFNRIMRAYIAGQFILCLLAGVIVGLWLWALGTKYPFILAVFAGLTRAIPVVGPIFGAIPIILLVLPTQGLPVALAFVVFFSILHLVETKFIMPLLIGDRIELHPVVIIVVLLVGGEFGSLLLGNQLGGLLGMFFAAPCAALVRFLVRRYGIQRKAAAGLQSREPNSEAP